MLSVVEYLMIWLVTLSGSSNLYCCLTQGSGSNVDLCVITAKGVEYLRPYDEANVKGQRYCYYISHCAFYYLHLCQSWRLSIQTWNYRYVMLGRHIICLMLFYFTAVLETVEKVIVSETVRMTGSAEAMEEDQ